VRECAATARLLCYFDANSDGDSGFGTPYRRVLDCTVGIASLISIGGVILTRMRSVIRFCTPSVLLVYSMKLVRFLRI
jgi:hypothetical protein